MPLLIAALLLVLLSAAPAAQAGPGDVASEGIEHVTTLRPSGSGQGAAVVGDRLFVTGPSHLTIYDIAEPEAPQLLGAAPIESANEAEDVMTNGRILAVGQLACRDRPGGCVSVFDVSDGANPQRISTIPVPGQIASCVADCRYLWITGPNLIADLADPAAPKVVGEFLTEEDDVNQCFQAREVAPGLILVACDPVVLLSTRAEDGGSPVKPVRLRTLALPDAQFNLAGAPHAAHWPRAAADRFILASVETPFHPQCGPEIGAFSTFDAKRFTRITSWRPQNGTYSDGRSPYNAVGCSPHFFDEHPAFADGGLVAVAALENGVRFLQVTPEGAIEERGWFLGAGGTAATPVWHPSGRVLYVADYARGVDVLRYTGPTYAPAASTPPAPAAPAAAPPAAPAAPARRFRIAGSRKGRRRGSAVLLVEVPGPGRVVVSARGRRFVVRATRAGLVRIPVTGRGRTLKVVARFGRSSLRASIALRR